MMKARAEIKFPSNGEQIGVFMYAVMQHRNLSLIHANGVHVYKCLCERKNSTTAIMDMDCHKNIQQQITIDYKNFLREQFTQGVLPLTEYGKRLRLADRANNTIWNEVTYLNNYAEWAKNQA